MRNLILASAALVGLMAACDETAPGRGEQSTRIQGGDEIPENTTYTPPEASGLVSVRPYPSQNDVCQVIGESDATSEFLDHTAILVGCPLHETGAIDDRFAEGGQRVATSGGWVLLSIPVR